jgi:hypothetical protein
MLHSDCQTTRSRRPGGELAFRSHIGVIGEPSEASRSAAGALPAGIDLSHAGERWAPA